MSKVNARQLEENSNVFDYCQKGVPAVCNYGVEKTVDTFTFGKGYFYHLGMSEEILASKIVAELAASGHTVTVVSKGDHFHGFVGGADRFSSKNSFMWVVCNVTKNA